MSRIGKQPVEAPAGVKVSISGRVVTVQGPQGTLTLEHPPQVKVAWDEPARRLNVSIDAKDAESRQVKAMWGSTRAHLRNMVEGVTKGYEKVMEVVGVGYTPTLAGKELKLVVGFANPIMMSVPTGVTVTVDKQFVRIKGADKQVVGQFAADMRAARKPEPYNGKGIKHQTEVIRRKQGKQFGA